jgi:hypothetical protein
MRIERRRINLGTQHSTLFFHISRRREQQAQQFVRERMNPIHRFNPGTAHPQINEVFRREIPAMPPATSGEERDLVIEHRHVPRPNVAARKAANLSLARRDRRPDPHRPKLSPMLPRVIAGLPQLLHTVVELDFGLRASLSQTQRHQTEPDKMTRSHPRESFV